MATITTELVLDVSEKNVMESILAKQNDVDSRFIKASLTKNKDPVTISSGATVKINAKRADGKSDSFSGTVDTTTNTVTVPITEWMLQIDGVVTCSISLISGTEILTTSSFTIEVEESEGGEITNAIEIRKGRTLSKSVTAITDSGEPYTPVTGDVVRFAVCEDRGGTVVISKTLEWDSTNQCWQLELDPADTSALEPGTYHYDIGIQFAAGGYADIIELTDFVILPSASQMISN